MDIVEILKALADETRIRILNLLYMETLCVCDLEEILKISQSNASRHMTKLKQVKLITGEKQAQWIYYRVNEKILEQYSFVKELLSKEMENDPQRQKDVARLKKYRELGGCCELAVKIVDD
ncbi:metalloregulator ArsR/SmtB family transcription factor [Sporomusa sp. KB1]|jgi:ArsR family transcriptional regulator|uniref:ArsR/SmtB family transcription factor n=1 Tax=Sporomusa sp. KB1 TaxID=943346 RepID=UPI00119F13CF|nr:metalloregulator ArsR/SmtB family transcription factor [Sporomusa sp. KB1]TWH45613.1 ArsR family transcriptional regulator [Sporomusa sp. KB1]